MGYINETVESSSRNKSGWSDNQKMFVWKSEMFEKKVKVGEGAFASTF